MAGNRLAAGLQDFHVTAPHLGDNRSDLQALGDARMAHYEYVAKCFHGEGAIRDLAVGEWFVFEGHPEIGRHPQTEREFVVTAQQITASNNLPAELGTRVERLFARSGWDDGGHPAAAGDHQPLRYRTSFTCVRRAVRIVPPAPAMPPVQLQSAIVVGPKNEEVWCDQLGRVKVRFPALREHDHEHASGAGTSNSDRDSAWIRVASGWA